MQNEFNDALAGDLKERDYQPTDGCNFPPEQEVKSLNEGSSNKNYVFNNCTVTINEEGKAIELLQEQEKRKAKMQETQMKLVEGIVAIAGQTINTMIESKMKKAMESEKTDEPVFTDPKTTTRKKATAKKKAPAKKVVKKK